MKQINLIINVVLALAVAALFYLHFSGDKDMDKSSADEMQAPVNLEGEIPIAYVQIDSLLANMQMYQDLNEKLTNKQQQLESNFQSQYKNFEKQVADAQNKIQKGLVTRSEAQDLQNQLGVKQSELENNRNNYMMELQEENVVSQNKVINYIMEYLEVYNADNRFRYIFSYSFGGGLLYAYKGMDITNEVLTGINKQYLAEKAEESKK
jgi:outer membrane protein